jgi:hypothetical protein
LVLQESIGEVAEEALGLVQDVYDEPEHGPEQEDDD